MAATDKSLARSDKSSTAVLATNERGAFLLLTPAEVGKAPYCGASALPPLFTQSRTTSASRWRWWRPGRIGGPRGQRHPATAPVPHSRGRGHGGYARQRNRPART
jgi:hypothetical protein